IAITTKSGNTPASEIKTEAGSLGWKQASASYRGSVDLEKGDLFYSANASTTDSDGVHELEFFEDTTAQFKLEYSAPSFEVGGSAFYSDSTFQAAELDDAFCCQTPETYWSFQTPDPDQANVTVQSVAGAYFKQD